MANDPREDIVINPAFFFVPEDVIDVRAGSGEDSEDFPVVYQEEDNLDADEVDVVYDEDISNPDSVGTVQTPMWLVVADQQVRIAPDGRSVIDVTFEVEEVAGAVDYQLRVTV